MPPRKGQKRKATDTTSDSTDLTPPDRETWPGWVEMESEPAFFNVMLKEMGTRGIKVAEVLSMDSDMTAMLPQPVHALIFLFRYKTKDDDDGLDPPDMQHVWFANQIPDFSCATVAMLNIINNIPGLDMGKELQDFKDFTKDMDPVRRGEAIDHFDFVRRIHNSFATQTDLLQADMHAKGKVEKYKKSVATAKALETKRAKQAAKTPQQDKSPDAESTSTRTSRRIPKLTLKGPAPQSHASRSADASSERSEDDFSPSAGKSQKDTNDETGAAVYSVNGTDGPRRSGRARRPPKERVAAAKVSKELEDAEEGFHFVAYMPIGDHVWKLDGLEYYPQDLGTFGAGGMGADGGSGDWVHAAAPAIQQRMADLEGRVEFNLMAIVRDPAVKEHQELVQNIKAIQAFDTKLDALQEGWREIEGAETKKDVVTTVSTEFGITQQDIQNAVLSSSTEERILREEDLMALIKLRASVVAQQNCLRANLRDAKIEWKIDEDKARHRRHDYRSFIKGWLGALADHELLGDLIAKVE